MDLFPDNSAFRVIHCRVSQRLLYTVSLCLFPGYILFRFYVSDDITPIFLHFRKYRKLFRTLYVVDGPCFIVFN